MTENTIDFPPKPDAKTVLLNTYNEFQTTRKEATKAKRDSYIIQVIKYFRSKPSTAWKPFAQIYDMFEDFELPEHEYLKKSLKTLMDLHEKQFKVARQVIDAVINLHTDGKQIDNARCVYWGAGYDEFAEGLGNGWWRYIGQYTRQNDHFCS